MGVPTYNETLELASIACLFKDPSLYNLVEDILEPKSYGNDSYGIVYKAFRNVVEQDRFPDKVSVEVELERMGLLEAVSIFSNGLRGRDALSYMVDMDVDVDALETYAYTIQEFRGTRQLIDIKDEMIKMLEQGSRPIDIISKLDIETGKVATYIGSQSKNIKSAMDVAKSAHESYTEAKDGKHRFIATGLAFWDDFTNGLYPQRLYMIAARSNEGKSALAQNIVKLLAVDRQIPVHIFSLEMSAEEVNNRLIQILTGISPLDLEKGIIPAGKEDSYADAVKKIAESKVSYDDSSELSLALLRTKMRRAVANGAKVIIIDQLEQLTIGGVGDKEAEYIKINYIAYRVKAYAREMDVPVILIHQLNRSSESGDKRDKDVDLTLSDLAQAGEKPCDAIIMIRTKFSPKIYWVKNRQGAKDSRAVKWDGSHITFSDIPGTTMFPLDDLFSTQI